MTTTYDPVSVPEARDDGRSEGASGVDSSTGVREAKAIRRRIEYKSNQAAVWWCNLQFNSEQGETQSNRSDVGSTEPTTFKRKHQDGNSELSEVTVNTSVLLDHPLTYRSGHEHLQENALRLIDADGSEGVGSERTGDEGEDGGGSSDGAEDFSDAVEQPTNRADVAGEEEGGSDVGIKNRTRDARDGGRQDVLEVE